jgi:hypothetical protein
VASLAGLGAGFVADARLKRTWMGAASHAQKVLAAVRTVET